jgi:hypothetical protein
MNASIRAIIDHMFINTVDTPETRALHEELLNNCLEHYEDLLSRGMSETEAIDAVVESLNGMKEVIDEYPKKPGSERQEEAMPEVHVQQPRAEEPPQEKPTEYVFDPAGIRTLRTELKGCDLTVGVSADRMIHVRCEEMEQIVCDKSGDSLWIKAVDKTKQHIAEAGKKLNNEEFSVSGLLNFIGKAIGSVASSITVSWNVYIDLPAGCIPEWDLNAKSGDIEVKASLPEKLGIHTMSGDAEVEAADGVIARKVTISTMSGDVKMRGDAERLTMSSMSGDVTARGSYAEAELKATSGDVELNGQVFRVRLNSVSGKVSAELHNTDAERIEAKSTSGNVEIELAPGTDSVHVSMSTVSGNTSNRFADAGHSARLQIQANSVSGNVKIR